MCLRQRSSGPISAYRSARFGHKGCIALYLLGPKAADCAHRSVAIHGGARAAVGEATDSYVGGAASAHPLHKPAF